MGKLVLFLLAAVRLSSSPLKKRKKPLLNALRPLKKVSVLLARESSVFECHSEIIVIVFE